MKIKLMEVGKDFQIKIRTYTRLPKYRRVKKLTITQEKIKISPRKLKKIVKNLQEKYPDKRFHLERRRVNTNLGRRVFWIFGRKDKGLKGVPIYYSTTLKKLYVPSTYVKRKYRLTCTVLLYRLRDLGVKYRLSYA